MAQVDKATFENRYSNGATGLFKTNTTNDIGSDDMRDLVDYLTDSFMSISDNFIDEDSFASDSATKAPSQQSVKAYVSSRVGTTSLLECTKTITTAEILTGNASPVTVLAAQGAGTTIQIIGPVIWKYTFGTAAFATNVTSNLYFNGAFAIHTASTLIGSGASRYQFNNLSSPDMPTASAVNAPITWSVTTGNPTAGGTSNLVIYFKYYVVTI